VRRRWPKILKLGNVYVGILKLINLAGEAVVQRVNVIWHCDLDTDKVYELSVTDFSVIRSADTPGAYPSGIGGDANTIWHCYSTSIYELSVTDFSVIRSVSLGSSSNLYGIGGDANVIWASDFSARKVQERSTTDFSVIRSADSPNAYPTGIGGTPDVIWHCSYFNVYELSVTDFSVIRSASGPDGRPEGIGGGTNKIWHCDRNADKVYELSTTDLSVIRSTSSPGTYPTGIGGK